MIGIIDNKFKKAQNNLQQCRINFLAEKSNNDRNKIFNTFNLAVLSANCFAILIKFTYIFVKNI